MKKIIAIFIATLFLFSFSVGCGNSGSGDVDPQPKEPVITTYADADYDGLYDDIDPAVNDNVYDFSFRYNGQTVQSEEYTRFSVDYRKLIKTGTAEFDIDVARLATILVRESYGSSVTIKNNAYKNDSSKISSAMVQIGGRDVERIRTLAKDYAEDKNDLSNLIVSNHVVSDGGEYKQVFIISVVGYATQSGWCSDFDVGADTEDYYMLTGTHTEWTNKAHHKGFDVTANRLIPKIESYMNTYAMKGAKQSIFITGHSRGGAVANLIAKAFTDKGVKTLAYCFNTPNLVAGASPADGYDGIINILNEDDTVSQVPLSGWNGFHRYGRDLFFKTSDDASVWESVYGQTYRCFTSDEISNLKNEMINIIASREDIYAFRTAYDDIYEHHNENEKDEIIATLTGRFANGTPESKCVKVDCVAGDNDYTIKYYTRPVLIVFAVNEYFNGDLAMVEKCIQALGFYAGKFGMVINAVENDFALLSIPHCAETDLIGINFIKN